MGFHLTRQINYETGLKHLGFRPRYKGGKIITMTTIRNGTIKICHLNSRVLKRVISASIAATLIGCSGVAEKPQKSYHPNGNVWEEWTEDRAGLKQGKAVTYYPNGQKQTEAIFKNGYLDGEFVMWSKKGEELIRGTYRSGEPWDGDFVDGFDDKKQLIVKKFKDGKQLE